MQIVLASNSLRRIELLKKIIPDFIISPPDIDENIKKSPFVLPLVLSLLKAENVLKKENELVIAADTIVSLNNRIFTKPKDYKNAVETLKALSNKTHTVITGVCVAYGSIRLMSIEKTYVTFNNLTLKQIQEYIKKFSPYDKAGSYGIQDDFHLVKSINGDYDNVVGLPINSVNKLIENLTIKGIR